MKFICSLFGHNLKPKSMIGNKVNFYRCSRCGEGFGNFNRKR